LIEYHPRSPFPYHNIVWDCTHKIDPNYFEIFFSTKIVYSEHWNTMNILYNEWRDFTSTTPLLLYCPRGRGTPASGLELGRGWIRHFVGPIYRICCEGR
jgi:hypothetical protein